MVSFRVMLGPDDLPYADAVVQALKDSNHPELPGCHITVRGPLMEGDRTTSIEGDNHAAGEVVFGIVLDTIDRERAKGK
jgi:hypothetical protein